MTASAICFLILLVGVLCSYFDDADVAARRRIRGWKRERLVVSSGPNRRTR